MATLRDRFDEDGLEFTVATTWREERVSCPHPDILRAWASGALAAEPAEFIEFHLRESGCPYCNAILEDQRELEDASQARTLAGMQERLLRSTISALRSPPDGV